MIASASIGERRLVIRRQRRLAHARLQVGDEALGDGQHGVTRPASSASGRGRRVEPVDVDVLGEPVEVVVDPTVGRHPPATVRPEVSRFTTATAGRRSSLCSASATSSATSTG